MNRQYKRNLKRLLNKKEKTKGAFGRPPQYVMDKRKEIWLKKAEKFAKNLIKDEKSTQDIVE